MTSGLPTTMGCNFRFNYKFVGYKPQTLLHKHSLRHKIKQRRENDEQKEKLVQKAKDVENRYI